jgi:hypothetical protein
MSAHIVIVNIELLVPHANSLKTKRREVKSLKDRLRARLNASVAEIDYLDQWQRSLIAVAMIGNDKRKLQQDVELVRQVAEGVRNITLLSVQTEWL